jgi:hypothetical protein
MTTTHRLAFLLTLGLLAPLAPAGDDKPPKPDLIVSDVFAAGNDLVVEVQNQGPGTAPKDKTVKLTVTRGTAARKATVTTTVAVPAAVFAIQQVRIPLDKLGDPDELGLIITVVVDPDNAIDEEREGNNICHRQIDHSAPQLRGAYRRSTELPDLVVTDVTADSTNLVVHYANVGKGATGADFLIRIRVGDQAFDGNYYYRFVVPPPFEEAKTGGFNLNLVGLMPGDTAEIEVTIDHEDRVRETDKKNNVFKKKVTIPRN